MAGIPGSTSARSAQVGSDMVITFDANNSITLRNFSIANFNSQDFIIS